MAVPAVAASGWIRLVSNRSVHLAQDAHRTLNSTAKQILRSWALPFLDPRPLANIARLPRYFAEWRRYRRMMGGERALARDLWPCLGDRTTSTPFDPHYFYQGAWLARRLSSSTPQLHVDAGSSVLMVSLLSARVPVVFLDYRPLRSGLSGILPVAGNLTRLPFADASLESVSCLHVIEHVGLGRYGDPLDPFGTLHALSELVRVVRPGGRLFVALPVGRERVCFNAHRVLAPDSVAAGARPLRLVTFSYVDDAGSFNEGAALEQAAGLEYGCGLFEFERAR